MRCQIQKNAQSFWAIFGVSEKSITERKNGWEIWRERQRERVNDERRQERVSINIEKLRKQYRKIPNCKTLGWGGVQGYWVENLRSLHERASSQVNRILMGENDLPEWMTHDRTVPCQKDLKKGNTAKNYRPITCLSLMWKLLTRVIAEEMYNYLEREKKFFQKSKKDEKEEVVEQRINYWLIRRSKRIARKDTPIYPWHG